MSSDGLRQRRIGDQIMPVPGSGMVQQPEMVGMIQDSGNDEDQKAVQQAQETAEAITVLKQQQIQDVTDSKKSRELLKGISEEHKDMLQELTALASSGGPGAVALSLAKKLAISASENYAENKAKRDIAVREIAEQIQQAGLSVKGELEKIPIETIIDCTTVESYRAAAYINTTDITHLGVTKDGRLNALALKEGDDPETVEKNKINTFLRTSIKLIQNFRKRPGQSNSSFDQETYFTHYLYMATATLCQGILYAAIGYLSYSAYQQVVDAFFNIKVERLHEIFNTVKAPGTVKGWLSLDQMKEKARLAGMPQDIIDKMTTTEVSGGLKIDGKTGIRDLGIVGELTYNAHKFVGDFVSKFLPSLKTVDGTSLFGQMMGFAKGFNLVDTIKLMLPEGFNPDIRTITNFTIMLKGFVSFIPSIKSLLYFLVRHTLILTNPFAVNRFFYVVMTKLREGDFYYKYDVMIINKIYRQFDIDAAQMKKFGFAKKSKKSVRKTIKKSVKKSVQKIKKSVRKVRKSVKKSKKSVRK